MAPRPPGHLALAATNLVSGDTYTVTGQATDTAGNIGTSSTVTFTYNTSTPTSTVTTSGLYSSSGTTYDGETSGGITGTATTHSGSAIQSVAVSVEQVSTGKCWTGTGSTFTASCPTYVPATSGTTSWSLITTGIFPAGGAYTVTSQATDGAGNVGSPSASTTIDVDYNPSTTIFVSTSVNGGSDSNNGTSPTTPVLTLNHTLSLVTTTRNVIAVSAGAYTQTVTDTVTSTAVIIRGGYSSSAWLRAAPGSNTVTITGTTNAGSTNANSMVGIYLGTAVSGNLEQLTINSGAPSTSAPTFGTAVR